MTKWLHVTPNGRKLQLSDGTPFFYLADTAWELLHRLDKEDTEHYLTTRASQGYTAIQTVILAERDGLRTPTPEGYVPLDDLDPTRLNEGYFAHVDWVVRRMNELGMTAALLPTWGDKVVDQVGEGPQVLNPTNARAYGRLIGERYRDAQVLWVLGGDRLADKESYVQTQRELAAGLKEGDGGRHLMTLHTMGGHSSAEVFHEEPWLDLNMWQTGHSRPEWDTSECMQKDWVRAPAKPVLDGEPCYENHPVMGGGWNPTGLRFTAEDVRRRAYRPVFGGACGHTYGCNEVWMMNKRGDALFAMANLDWKSALHLPGANQMRHLRSLVESRPFLELMATDGVVLALDSHHYNDICTVRRAYRWGPHPEPAEVARPTTAAGRDYLFVYLPMGSAVKLDLSKFGDRVELWWFDPRHGTAAWGGYAPPVGEWVDPPYAGQDWVLVAQRPDVFANPPGMRQGQV